MCSHAPFEPIHSKILKLNAATASDICETALFHVLPSPSTTILYTSSSCACVWHIEPRCSRKRSMVRATSSSCKSSGRGPSGEEGMLTRGTSCFRDSKDDMATKVPVRPMPAELRRGEALTYVPGMPSPAHQCTQTSASSSAFIFSTLTTSLRSFSTSSPRGTP